MFKRQGAVNRVRNVKSIESLVYRADERRLVADRWTSLSTSLNEWKATDPLLKNLSQAHQSLRREGYTEKPAAKKA